jgi:hypothetical protein
MFIAALVLGLAVGCGSKSDPTGPDAKHDPAPNPTTPGQPADPGAPATKGDAPSGPVWEIEQSKHAIPSAPVKGRIAGTDVLPEVGIEGDELTFRTVKAGTPVVERSVRLKLAPMRVAGQPVPVVMGRDWKVAVDAPPGPNVPEVWRDVPGKGQERELHVYPHGYALTLELGQRKDGKVPGKIYLSLSDQERTVLAGTFEATFSRSHLERPEPDEAPYVVGTVTVTGAKPDAEVRASYAAFTEKGIHFKELQLPFDPVPPEQARYTRDESDKPRTSTLVAGDGKLHPFRFEHVKLAPGRYLIAAAVVGGPTAWKWVDVGPGTTQTEAFTIDATQTGGVEVSVAPEVKGKVIVAPADAPDKPVLAPELFRALASQVVRQDADVVAGKATLKNLAPGRYEVRVDDLRGFVDVVAGKTAELNLVPKK